MKLVKLREGALLKSIEIFRAVLERAPPTGLHIPDVRKRNRVLKVLDEAAGDTLLLEDADHATLVGALDVYAFGMASIELETIVDDVLQAKEPPAAVTKPADRAASS